MVDKPNYPLPARKYHVDLSFLPNVVIIWMYDRDDFYPVKVFDTPWSSESVDNFWEYRRLYVE